MLATDVSNWTGPLTPEVLAEWKAAGVGLVIVQAVAPPPGYPPGVTRQQVEACAAAGLAVDVYLWLWTHSDVQADMRHKLSLLDGLEHHVRQLWLDVEDVSDAEPWQRARAVRLALEVLDAWSTRHGKPRPGIYTALWYWPHYLANTAEFADRELWDADYDDVADAAHGWQSYGGWTARRIKQYDGDATLSGVSGIDLNVLSVEEAAEIAAPPPPAEAPCAGLVSALGYVCGDQAARLDAESRRRTMRRRELRAIAAELRRVGAETL